MSQDMVDRFFALARERHSVHLRRVAGLPRPWTEDPILRQYKFTNVFRELDRTTAWFRQHVREPMRADPRVLLATVVFRWLNRVTTGEAIFLQGNVFDGPGRSAFEVFAETGDVSILERAILAYCGDGPYVTGAYMIKSPTGMPKLAGMMKVIGDFYRGAHVFPGFDELVNWRDVADHCLRNRDLPEPTSLRDVWDWLRDIAFQGPFHAYEVVSDLRHTALLDHAPDILTWANPGPGAQRGLNRIHNRINASPRKAKHKWRPGGVPREQYIQEMLDLRELSRDTRYWPQKVAGDAYGCDGYGLDSTTCAGPWPAWEMREVEHWLCEVDKHQRVFNGEGEPRGRYDGG